MPKDKFFFMVLGFELMASHLLGRYSTLETLHEPFFVFGNFEKGFQKLFAQTGFKPQSF
jgi:hypothetical protein